MTDYPLVFRENGPNKGRMCRVIRNADVIRDHNGSPSWNVGSHIVGIEWSDGTRDAVTRQSIISVRTRLGRAAVANAGLTAAQLEAKRRAKQRDWYERRKVSTP